MNIALQIDLNTPATVDAGANVLFDDITLINGNISYEPSTGVVTFEEAGRYVINWWLATQSSVSTNGAAFALSTSLGNIVGNSPIKTGQVYGIGIIEVTAAPVTMSLNNISTGTFFFSTIVPLKGSLVVVQDDAAGIGVFGGLFSVIPQSFTFTAANEIAQIALPTQMPVSNVVLGGNAIQISIPGFYEVNFMIRVGSVAAATTINAGVRLNGGSSFITSTFQSAPLSLTENTIFQGSVIVALGAGSVLDLALQSTGAATVSLAANTNATLSAKLLMSPS